MCTSLAKLELLKPLLLQIVAFLFAFVLLLCMANTGYLRKQQRDMNPNSPTYNTVRWSEPELNTTACPLSVTYQSAAISSTVYKDDCQAGYEPGGVVYTLPAGHSTSTISQADANAKAQAYYDANKQAYANANDDCFIAVVLDEAGRSSLGYLDLASACNYSGESDAPVYTETGTLTNGAAIYWSADGSQGTLGNGYYKLSTGAVMRVFNGVIESTHVPCD